MDRWCGRTAVVTGASAGIGAAISLALADAGVNVVGVARRSTLVDELKSKITGKGQIYSKACDVSQPHQVLETFTWVEDKFGGIDILVNNAGIVHHGQITDVGAYPLTEPEVLSQIDVNVKGTILCTRHAVASMKKRNFSGHIVNINSIAGHYIPQLPILNVYTATKHAVTAFTQSLNVELAAAGQPIKTTSISPGLVATDMVAKSRIPELQDAANECPMLKPSDVAGAVLYALSTSPQVNISEITIQPVGEKKL